MGSEDATCVPHMLNKAKDSARCSVAYRLREFPCQQPNDEDLVNLCQFDINPFSGGPAIPKFSDWDLIVSVINPTIPLPVGSKMDSTWV